MKLRALQSASRAAAGLLLALPLASACFLVDRAAVGVERVGPDAVDGELNQHALTGPRPSASSLETLHYFGLSQRFEDDPEAALVELHRAVVADPERRFLHALAELSYLRGKAERSRDHYLAAAVYAYLYLLGEEQLPAPSAYDRTFRWACDLYNRGLRAAFLAPEGEEFLLQDGARTLPVGSLAVAVDRSSFPIDDEGFHFLPADDYSVWGLSVRVRDSGLGAPLVARREGRLANDPLARFHGEELHAPATAFLRVEGTLAELERGLKATLELHSSFEPLEVQVGGKSVPLESDFSATLALALDRSAVWSFSSRGFFGKGKDQTGLTMSRPHQPGLVPVVFVHGTASNPAYWAEMFNLLQAEPEIRERMQFWFFRYPSGSPIPFSAAGLRATLLDLVATLDPEGDDAALRHAVIIGHSQGGLLTKLMAVDGDIAWWEELVGVPFDELEFEPQQRELVRKVLDFDPLPFVERVVFVCTPHRGSFLAERPFSRWLAKLIALPSEVTDLGDGLLKNQKKLPAGLEPRVPTALDNMNKSNPFLRLLARTPIVARVKAHSIIAIDDADPAHPEDADDGVVKYTSAHIEGVESECLLPVGHSCQSDPRTIAEVRRILLEHLRGLP